VSRTSIRLSWRLVALILSETLLIVGAVVAATVLRLRADAWDTMVFERGLEKAVLIAVICQICLYCADLYDLRVGGDRLDLFIRTFRALGAATLIVAALYYCFPPLVIGRGVFVIAALLVVTVVVLWRFVFAWAVRHARPRERLLLVGTGPAVVNLARELFDRRADLGVVIVGFADSNPVRVGEPLINPGIIGTVDELPALISAHSVDRVVISFPDALGRVPMDTLFDLRLRGISFAHLADVYEQYTGKLAIDTLRPNWLIFAGGFEKGPVLRGAKRTVDLAGAALLLLLACPLMAFIALAVKVTSRGRVLYRQNRVGQHGHVFGILKFRSMYADAEAKTGPVWATPGDDGRVTPIGRVLRRLRFDELPQLWNVIIGEMSLVGPRPERPEFVDDLNRRIPFYGQRHVVRPGVTGWAQVRYAYGASLEDALEKLQYDLFYIKNMSFPLDVFILFATMKAVLFRPGS
jgi:sugar transferase (PEP-CTERM system associated)